MKEYKLFTLEEVKDYVWLSEEGWRRVRNAPEDERVQVMRREFSWPEGFLEQLKNKPLEEQMGYYRIVETAHYSRTAYGEITRENCHRFGYALEDYPGLQALVVEDGVLLGACIKPYNPYGYPWGVPAFPYHDICTYYASDNNGSGSKDREDYAHLCCVVPEEEN